MHSYTTFTERLLYLFKDLSVDIYSCSSCKDVTDIVQRCRKVLLKFLSHPLAEVRIQAYATSCSIIKVVMIIGRTSLAIVLCDVMRFMVLSPHLVQ